MIVPSSQRSTSVTVDCGALCTSCSMSRFRVPGSMLVLKDMSEKYCYIHCQFKMILHSDMSDVFDTRCASVFGLHLYNGSCDLGTSATARPLAITARICLHIGMISSSVALSGKSMTSTTGGSSFRSRTTERLRRDLYSSIQSFSRPLSMSPVFDSLVGYKVVKR